MASVTFVTGFPGFLGTRLVASLLAVDAATRIVALVEPRMAHQATAAAAMLDPERVEILLGDIAERRLGLDQSVHDRLAAEMTSAYHLAAIYNLAVPLEIAQRVNVDGTGNVIELCARADGLERFNYVSTAYVAGVRKGVVYEHELLMGQRFKNHYESTKFQAEVWVRDAMATVPTTIYRPAIVVGDSRTGQTQKFDGPYYLLRMLQRLRERNLPIPQIGRSTAPFNVVPVDFVVDAMVAAAGDPQSVGETFHLVDPEPLQASQLLGMLSQEYLGRGTDYRVPGPVVAESLRIKPLQRFLGGTPRESIRYLNHEVRFDTRRTGDMLERQGLRCPRFSEYVKPVVDFFRRHEDDPAFLGEGKPQQSEPSEQVFA
jgi:thioester reductase-like protein